MPIIEYVDTLMLLPASTDLSQSLVYTDMAAFHTTVPNGYIGVVVLNVPEEVLNTLTINTIEDKYSLFLASSADTFITTVRYSTSVSLVLFDAMASSNDTPSLIVTKQVSVVPTAPWITISPDPSLEYSSPTEFTIHAPANYDFVLTLNDAAFNFPGFPYVTGAQVHNKGMMLSNDIKIIIDRPTKLSFFYYSNAVYSYNSIIEDKIDEFFINVVPKFNFTIENYGKIASFSSAIEAIVTFTGVCEVEITTIDLERKLQVSSIVSIDQNKELVLNIDSSRIIELKTLAPIEIIKKYIFKRETSSKTVYTFYDNDGTLTNNILEGNLYNLEQSGGSLPG